MEAKEVTIELLDNLINILANGEDEDIDLSLNIIKSITPNPFSDVESFLKFNEKIQYIDILNLIDKLQVDKYNTIKGWRSSWKCFGEYIEYFYLDNPQNNKKIFRKLKNLINSNHFINE